MLLALCGRAGSGKSSVARYLEDKYGFERMSFATPLKRMAMDIWGFSEEQVFGEADTKETVDERWGITPRQAMQSLGQAARDHLWCGVWIDAAFKNLSGHVVIEDLRYVNEELAVRGQGGKIVKLVCIDSISKDEGVHPSEKEIAMVREDVLLTGSRAKGLGHLFGLVDEWMERNAT